MKSDIIDYIFLDYDFLENIAKINEHNTAEYIDNFKKKILNELKVTKSLIVIYFNKDKCVSYFTTKENEISEIIDIQIFAKLKDNMHVFITYLDKNNIPRDGYILKFNNNFVLYRNSFDIRINNMAKIPYLDNIKRNDIYIQVKNKFSFLISLIAYLKNNNNIYTQSSIRDIIENNFDTKNIKLNYYNNKFRIEYIINDKKYNIIILKEYNADIKYNYIGFIYEIADEKPIIENQLENNESVIKNYLNEIDKSFYEAGLYDLINHYKVQYSHGSLPDIIYKIMLKDETYKTVQKNISHNNFHKIINTNFKITLDNISDSLINKQESVYVKNLIDNFHKVKSFIINDDSSNIINIKQKLDFHVLNLFQLINTEKYYISLDKDNKIYEFTLMEINSENIIAVLKEVNNIEKDKLIYIISIKPNE